MTENRTILDDELGALRGSVTDAVLSSDGTKPNEALRERLRTYERTAVALALEPQTLQVIRSGRRLLGDTDWIAEAARPR